MVDADSLNIDSFKKQNGYDKNFRQGFWVNTSKRFFIIYEYMKINNIENVLHLENDVLIYNKMDYDFDEKIYITMDNENRCIPGIV